MLIMELKEKLELLNEKSSIAEIQKYIKDMKKARKFDEITIEREMMLFLEELGELAKAIRKNTNGRLDISKEYNDSVEEELADCFIYLLSIANRKESIIFLPITVFYINILQNLHNYVKMTRYKALLCK